MMLSRVTNVPQQNTGLFPHFPHIWQMSRMTVNYGPWPFVKLFFRNGGQKCKTKRWHLNTNPTPKKRKWSDLSQGSFHSSREGLYFVHHFFICPPICYPCVSHFWKRGWQLWCYPTERVAMPSNGISACMRDMRTYQLHLQVTALQRPPWVHILATSRHVLEETSEENKQTPPSAT